MTDVNSDGVLESLKEHYSRIEQSFETAIAGMQEYPKEKNQLTIMLNKNVKKSLGGALATAEAVMKEPFYVVFFGHYSHGKTSLINALFDITAFPLKTGDGQMTSKMVRVEFTDGPAVTAYRLMPGGKSYEETDYHGLYEGSSGGDELATGFYLKLPKGDSAIAEEFFNRRVNLIDAPGMGGKWQPGFNEVQKYTKEADLILIVINAVEISKAKEHIEWLMKQPEVKGKKKIVVLSFWDEVAQNPEYSHLPEDQMESAVKKKLAQEIDSLGDLQHPVLCVTSVNRQKGVAELRKEILDTLLGVPSLIEKDTLRLPEIESRRLGETKAVLSKVCSDAQATLNAIEKALPSSHGSDEVPTITHNLETQIKSCEKSANKAVHAALAESKNEFFMRLGSINSQLKQKEVNDFLEQFENEVNRSIFGRIKQSVYDEFKACFVHPLSLTVLTAARKLNFDDSNEIERFKETIERISPDLTSLEYRNPSSVTVLLKQMVEDTARTITATLQDSTFVGFVIMVFVVTFLLALLAKADFLLKLVNVDVEQIRSFVYFIAVIVVVSKFWLTSRDVRDRGFIKNRERIREQILASFDIPSYEKTITAAIEKSSAATRTEIYGFLNPLLHEKTSVRGKIRTLRKDVETTITSMQAEIDTWIAST